MMQAQAQIAQELALPAAISSLIVGLIVVFGANALLKSDPRKPTSMARLRAAPEAPVSDERTDRSAC
jgi:hypothetical protein